MRCALVIALATTAFCGCSLDSRPLPSGSDSVTSEMRDQSRLARAPSLPRSTQSSPADDAGAQSSALDAMTMLGTGKSQTDAAEPAPEPQGGQPAKPEATGGRGAAGAQAGVGAVSGAGVVAGGPSAGARAPSTNKEAVIAVLNERASMNGTDALLVRSVVAQLDSPLPANAGSLRLLLTTALTSFGCPAQSTRECTAICGYVGDVCLSCASDQQCREQLVVVCPNSLAGCLPGGGP